MKRYFVPELVEFELVECRIQMTFWIDTPDSKFWANINGVNYVLLSTGQRRLVHGKITKGFQAVPQGSELYMVTNLADCPEAYLFGTFRPSPEDCGAGFGKL